jgi:6-oxo-cyclohex-1-ene-carbonyl-CoA hydrolase
MNAPELARAVLKSHDLVDAVAAPGVRYELRPAQKPDGTTVSGLYNAWITLDNPSQFNSYTTDMVKAVILGF